MADRSFDYKGLLYSPEVLGGIGLLTQGLSGASPGVALPSMMQGMKTASMFSAMEKEEEKKRLIEQYSDKVPEDQKALLNKGSVLIELDKFEEAVRYYDKILEINPNNVKALASKGIALSHLHKYDEALISLDKALSLEPDNKVIRDKKANFLSGAISIPARPFSNSTISTYS